MTISSRVRTFVIERAGGCCEYCRVNQQYSSQTFHVEHIIARAHGGRDDDNNLALSCTRCNLYKGTNIATADPLTGEPTFLFNPRRHNWHDHFALRDGFIEPLTPEGRATVFVLHINDAERTEERILLQKFERYPCPEPA